MAALVESVVQTNLRTMQELLRVESAEGLVELQQRFVGEYLTALVCGSMTLVNAIKSEVTPT